jgi:hypothetical protein
MLNLAVINMWFMMNRNVWGILALLLVLNSALAKRKCGLEHAKERFTNRHLTSRHLASESGFEREDDWDNIRIAVEYYQTDIGSDDLQYVKSIVENAITWYENVLSVKRLTDNILLDDSYIDNEELGGWTPPDSYFSEGVEADYLFFVSFVSDPELDFVGTAIHISQDPDTDQPIVGVFDLNYYDGFSYEDLLSTTIHEMAHALGFNNDLFEYFINEDGEKYGEDEVAAYFEENGEVKVKVVTPTVLDKAREAFGCDDLNGVELELQGGEGTELSHWDKRVLYNDFMSPDAGIDDVVYSDITLALFEDSGWYTANYEYTQSITWGYKMGCDLLEETCIVDEEPINQLFCVEEGKEMCDYQRLNKGYCNLGELEDQVPEEYQYFNDSYLGGDDDAFDFCPLVKQAEGGNCRGHDYQETDLNSDYGEEVCENCRCVEGTYSKNNQAHYHLGCHWIECEEDYTIVHIGDEEVQCDSEGGEVEVPNYNGVLYCPKWEEVCNPVPCLNACSGIGVCNRGVCECPDGSMGGDCSDIDKDFSYRDPIGDDDEDSAQLIGALVSLLLLILN